MKHQRVCGDCGGNTFIERKDYEFYESGLADVLLKNIEIERCRKCANESPVIPNRNDLMRTIAVALISKPSKLTRFEVQWIREHLGKKSAAFAKLLGIDPSHLSRVENDKMAVSRQIDRLVRALVLVHEPELLAKLKRLGQGDILKLFSAIKDDAHPVEVQLTYMGKGYTFDLKA
jgi:putative zinc finger/helix-turn-helix YgiT family protein